MIIPNRNSRPDTISPLRKRAKLGSIEDEDRAKAIPVWIGTQDRLPAPRRISPLVQGPFPAPFPRAFGAIANWTRLVFTGGRGWRTISLGNRVGGVQPVCVPYFYRIRPPRFLCARLASSRPRAVCARRSRMAGRRGIVIVVPEVLANF